jgi:hypothetical protein
MDDRGWKAMQMLDWKEGRMFEFGEGSKPERILPQDLLAALTSAVEVRERYVTYRFCDHKKTTRRLHDEVLSARDVAFL